MPKFTVVGFYQSSSELFAHHVEAETGLRAIGACAAESEDMEIVCAIDGEHEEGMTLTFPGDTPIDSQTIQGQPEIYGHHREPEDNGN